MRQRLSSEPDRYRGRRRVPTPPRSRYAAVVTTAFVGAGVVALGAGASCPTPRRVDPAVLADLEQAAPPADDLADRADAADRASRGDEPRPPAPTPRTRPSPTSGCSRCRTTLHLPVRHALGQAARRRRPGGAGGHAVRGGARRHGHPAGWSGGYGYAVIVHHGDGIETIYGHSSAAARQGGEQVKAGDQLGLVGTTGHSYGSHLHLEVHVNGQPPTRSPWLQRARSGHQAASRVNLQRRSRLLTLRYLPMTARIARSGRFSVHSPQTCRRHTGAVAPDRRSAFGTDPHGPDAGQVRAGRRRPWRVIPCPCGIEPTPRISRSRPPTAKVRRAGTVTAHPEQSPSPTPGRHAVAAAAACAGVGVAARRPRRPTAPRRRAGRAERPHPGRRAAPTPAARAGCRRRGRRPPRGPRHPGRAGHRRPRRPRPPPTAAGARHPGRRRRAPPDPTRPASRSRRRLGQPDAGRRDHSCYGAALGRACTPASTSPRPPAPRSTPPAAGTVVTAG